MRILRASELSTFVYCQRAWWYRKSGHTPENQSELAGGIQLHQRHGRAVFTAGCLRLLAYALLLFSLVYTVAILALEYF